MKREFVKILKGVSLSCSLEREITKKSTHIRLKKIFYLDVRI